MSLNALKRKGTGNDSVDENNNKNETAKFKGNTDTDTDTDDRMIYRNNPMLFDDDDKPAKEVQKDGVRQCFCVSLYKRIWQQCKDGMSVQHEWLSPFTLNAETAHFTPAMRIILLVFVLLSEILCEALLYDLYNPDQAGTCSIVNVNLTKFNVTNTTNVTTSELYVDGILQNDTSLLASFNGISPSSLEEPEEEEPTLVEFGAVTVTETFLPPPPEAPPLEDILTGLTTAIMVVPLASVCVGALMKIADGNQHQALWERYGIQDLKDDHLVVDRHIFRGMDGMIFIAGLLSCGATALVYLGEEENTNEGKQDNILIPKNAICFTLTSKTAVMAIKTAETAEKTLFYVRLFDPIQGELLVPCQTMDRADELSMKCRFIVCHLPINKEFTGAAICAAMGRLSAVVTFHNTYGNPEREEEKRNFCCCFSQASKKSTFVENFYVRNELDRQTCQHIEKLCDTMLFHAEAQERLLSEIMEWQKEKANEQALKLKNEREKKKAGGRGTKKPNVLEACMLRSHLWDNSSSIIVYLGLDYLVS